MKRSGRCSDFQRLIESPSPTKENVDKNTVKNSESSKNKSFIRKLFGSSRSIKCECQKKDESKLTTTNEPLIQL